MPRLSRAFSAIGVDATAMIRNVGIIAHIGELMRVALSAHAHVHVVARHVAVAASLMPLRARAPQMRVKRRPQSACYCWLA